MPPSQKALLSCTLSSKKTQKTFLPRPPQNCFQQGLRAPEFITSTAASCADVAGDNVYLSFCGKTSSLLISADPSTA